MRQGELLGLKWIDVDWAASQLHIRRKVQRISKKGFVFSPPKTQAGIRLIQLGPETMRQLIEHRKRQNVERNMADWVEHDLAFPSLTGNPTDQRNLIRFCKRLLKRVGLPDIRFHDLRHYGKQMIMGSVSLEFDILNEYFLESLPIIFCLNYSINTGFAANSLALRLYPKTAFLQFPGQDKHSQGLCVSSHCQLWHKSQY